MKKVILLSTVLLYSLTDVLSQDEVRKAFTSASLGISIPTGNFRSNNFNNDESGYAKTGLTVDFTLEHNILKKLGVIGIFRSQANAVNAGEYAQDLANYLGADNPEETTSVSVESSPYSLGGIMTGLYGSFPIVNKFSFEPHALVGFSVATLPASTTKTYESNTKLTTFIWEQSATFAFSYIIGTKAKLDISKRICVLFNIDYYAAKAEWDNVQEVGIGHITNNTKIYMYDYSQKFSTINLIAGLGFKF